MTTMVGLETLADGILVINLDDRPDRWRDVLDELSPYVDTARLHRLSAVKGTTLEGFGERPLFGGRSRDRTWAGRAGCALSHREAIAYAARQGWHSVLILEDDIQIRDGLSDVCANLARALEQCAWDFCYLGFTDPVGPFRLVRSLDSKHSLFRVYGCNTAHAYLVRDSVFDELLKRMPTREKVWGWIARNRAVDRWYMRSFSRNSCVLVVSPSVIGQKQGFSDITGRNQEFAHLTQVPGRARSMFPYGFWHGLRHLRFMITNSYDAVRGAFKLWKGF
ncbi:MAG TPA: glycosyl transferase [Gammaproteobacteria bacterium]|nr:glycosyl transferase [Gammaproteobacteria bacterium]